MTINQRLPNIPTIFISSLDDFESRLEGYDAGGIDYVITLPSNWPVS
jgi:PleD family two-component response regulator